MRKKCICSSTKINNQRGVAFPFFLFLMSALLMAVGYSVSIYQSNIRMSQYHEQRLVNDSLYQMAGEQLKEDLPTLYLENSLTLVNYDFPGGKVSIYVARKDENIVKADFQIEPDTGQQISKTKFLAYP